MLVQVAASVSELANIATWPLDIDHFHERVLAEIEVLARLMCWLTTRVWSSCLLSMAPAFVCPFAGVW